MKTLKLILEENLDNSIEIPNKNLLVSFFEQEHRLNMAPIDPAKPSTQARSLINQLKTKFQVSGVKQEAGNIFEITIDPRVEFPLVIDFIKNNIQ